MKILLSPLYIVIIKRDVSLLHKLNIIQLQLLSMKISLTLIISCLQLK